MANGRPLLMGDPDVPALIIDGTGSSALLSLRIESPNAVTAGASSIALLVKDATVDLDQVDQLVARSLVDVDTTGVITRYRMLQPIRELAADRLVA